MEAQHRDPGARLFRHLDGRLIATTNAFHEVGVSLRPGRHILSLAGQKGDRRSRRFQVLDTGQGSPRGSVKGGGVKGRGAEGGGAPWPHNTVPAYVTRSLAFMVRSVLER